MNACLKIEDLARASIKVHDFSLMLSIYTLVSVFIDEVLIVCSLHFELNATPNKMCMTLID